ncbi:MAG: carbohydrate binding domain-containing protein [Micropruina sp.]
MKFAGVDSSAVGVRCFPQVGQYIADGDSQTVRLPGRDGELFLSATQGPVEFPVTVRADAADAAAARTLLDGVAAWLARGPAQLVFDELPDRYWTARLRGGLAWSLGAGSYRVVSNIVMRADDPHAYALTDDTAVLTAPGAVARTKGNAPSRPTVWVTGTLTGGQSVTLNLWGKTVTLTGPLSAGEVALLDYRDYTFRVVALTWTEVARNLATNPSFEATSTTVEVRRNFTLNPAALTGGSSAEVLPRYSWTGTYQASGGPVGAGGPASFRRLTVGDALSVGAGRGFDWYVNSEAGVPGTSGDAIAQPVTAGVAYTVSCWVRVSKAATVALSYRLHNGAGAWQTVSSTAVTANPTAGVWTRYSFTFTPAANGYLAVGNRINSTGWLATDTYDQSGVLIEAAPALGDYFDGANSPDPDLTPAWVGTAAASVSVLTAPGCAGPSSGPYGMKTFQSGLWALSGAKSYRQSTTQTSGERVSMLAGGFATLMGLTPGVTYTIMATCRIAKPLTNLTPDQPVRLALRWLPSGRVYSDPVANEVGVHSVRFVATLPAAATAAMIEANMWGAGDLWWDDLAIVEGVYDGPPFNGGTISDSPNRSYAWVGTPNASASIARSLTGTTPIRNLAGNLSNLARISCPVGGGPVSWTTTGSISQVAIACNSRWI